VKLWFHRANWLPLQSLFRNLDRLVAPDRPCSEFLWWEIFFNTSILVIGFAWLTNFGTINLRIGILAFHKALVDQPRDPTVVASFCLAIYSEVSLSEAIAIARSNSKQHNSHFQELSSPEKDTADSESKISQQVIKLAESIRSAARKLNNRDYIANAMSKYPQAPGSDMVGTLTFQ